MFWTSLRRHAIDQVVAVAMDPRTDPATRAELMHHVLDTANGSSATRGAGPSSIVEAEQVGAYGGAKETGSIAPRPMRTLLANRGLQWIIVAVSALVLAAAIYWLIRQSHYRWGQPAKWFAEDAVLIGLIAVVAAVVTAAFAYPTFKEWKDQISGPKPGVEILSKEPDGSFKELPKLPREATLREDSSNEVLPVLRIIVTNSSDVALRDGRLGIYVKRADGGSGLPPVTAKPDAFQELNFVHIRYSSSLSEPNRPATLLTIECLCPPGATSYFQHSFDFRGTDVDLRFVLTGSNLRAPWTGQYKVHLSPSPGNSSRAIKA